jgi:hypothetical protein
LILQKGKGSDIGPSRDCDHGSDLVSIQSILFDLAVDAGASPVSGLSVSEIPETVRQMPEKPNQIKGRGFLVRQRKPLISLTPHSPARLTTFSAGRTRKTAGPWSGGFRVSGAFPFTCHDLSRPDSRLIRAITQSGSGNVCDESTPVILVSA